MQTPGLIIIGSGPAGIGAAEAFRDRDSTTPVRILTADTEQPYMRPPLSKDFLRGESEAPDARLHPDEWYAEHDVELVTEAQVEAIDTGAKTVTARGETHPYSALVIAGGASPSAPPFPGGDDALLLRSLSDATRLRDAAAKAGSAVVIGAGFIGCEAAASLSMRGVATTLVAPDPLPQLKRLGEDAGARIRQMVADAGVRWVGGVSVESIERIDGAETQRVRLDNGVSIDCDFVLAATGVSPQSSLADAAGVDTRDGRIVVDSSMRTSVDDVYAAGDVALAHNDAATRHVAVEHWQDAENQGKIAGAVAAGADDHWDAVPGFWSDIGDATLKYHAWGDGWEHAHFRERCDGFSVWYERDGAVVGVLTHNADDDYDRGEALISDGKPLPDDVAR